MKHLVKGVALLLASFLLLTGCNEHENNPSSNPDSSTTTQGAITTTEPSETNGTMTSTTSSEQTTTTSQEPVVTDPTEGTDPTQTPVTAPSVTKVMSAEQGKNYLIVRPTVNHPGVVEMDAQYEISVSDKMQNVFASDDFTLQADNDAVQINGNVLTIPWSVRSSGQSVTVTAHLKNEPVKAGSFTFEFQQFQETPTFVDDFNTLDKDTWELFYTEKGSRWGEIEDGNLVFRIEKEGDTLYEMQTKEFAQAYGCFSARIDMPKSGQANAAFWMKTDDGVRYIKNPAMPNASGGEIDIVEYFPTWGDQRLSTALHYYAWHPNYIQSVGDDSIQVDGNIRDGYHVYSVVWTPTAIYWYFDDQLINSYTGEGVAEGSGPLNLLLQLNPEYPEFDEDGNQIEGWGGMYDGTGFPYEMKTDWVKAWALA